MAIFANTQALLTNHFFQASPAATRCEKESTCAGIVVAQQHAQSQGAAPVPPPLHGFVGADTAGKRIA